ncbi:MAG TPA: type II toxin-antitoxin system VapC family toxin [Thermoanaerobaculia bacterium]
MIILDTNVLSALMRQEPAPDVVAWLDRLPPESIWTTAVTVFEIRFGLQILESGRRRQSLERAFAAALAEDFDGRVLPFDQPAAEAAGRIAAERRRVGRTIEIRDVQIAGITIARKASLATRNTRHFEDLGLSLIDPWSA